MTDPTHAADVVAAAADELLPQLSERLTRYGLGEIEIADGDLRLRVSAGAARLAASALSLIHI